MRSPNEISMYLKALLNRYNFHRNKQILIFLRGNINDSLRYMQMCRKFYCPKVIALLCPSILVLRIEMMHVLMHVLQNQPLPVN